MKRTFHLRTLIGLFIFALIQIGCQKENFGNHPKSGNERSEGLTASCDSVTLPGSTVIELMVNPDDAEDTRLNYILYHYAQAVRKAATDSTKLCQMINALLATEGGLGTVPLLKFAEDNPNPFGNELNTDIKESIAEAEVYPIAESGIDELVEDPEWNANGYLRERTTYYQDESDEPVIYFIRPPSSCDLRRDVVIVIATDVDDCDDVAGWKGNNEIILSEDEARTTDDIVIFVGLGQREPINQSLVSPGVHQISTDVISERTDIDIDVDEHRIKKRFDCSNKSEIYGQWTYYDPNVGFVEDYGVAPGFAPRKIHKNDIGANGSLFTDDKEFIDIPNASWSIHLTVYEYDWYASNKDIKNNCVQDDDYTMVGKRKKSSDMYINECVILASTWFPSVNSTKTFNNDNSTFKLKRKN